MPMPTKAVGVKIRRWCSVFADLFFVRWANIRNEWYFYFLLAPIFPLAMLVFLRLVGAIEDPAQALYMTAGNGVIVLVMGPMQSLSNDLAIARQRNDLEYFAALPFSKLQLVLAYGAVSSLATIPATLLALTVGALWLSFPVSFNPLIVVVMVTAALSMAGVGVFMGVIARNIHHANMLNTLGMVLVMFVSPMYIQYENMPVVLQWTSRLLPPSYAADGLRAALAGSWGWDLWFNVLMLALFASVLLTLATRKLDWRAE